MACTFACLIVSAKPYEAQAASDRWYKVLSASHPIGPIASDSSGTELSAGQLAGKGDPGIFYARAGLGGICNSDYCVGIDGDGVLWYNVYGTLDAQYYHHLSSWRFSKLKYTHESGVTNSAVWAYGHQLPETSLTPGTSVITQMPTTGAPEGLSTVGLVAVGFGMLAVGVGLAKRERF